MSTVSATEFQRNFGQYNIEVQHEPIAVSSHGRVTGYYISAREFEAIKPLLEQLPKSYTLATMPEKLYQTLLNAKMDPRHNHLNSLMEDDDAK